MLTISTLSIGLVLALLACEQQAPPPELALEEVLPKVEAQALDTHQISTQLWQAGQAALLLTLDETNRFYTAIDALLSNPSEASLQQARTQWEKAFTAFAEVQPLLYTELSESLDKSQSVIAHWPFYPGFIDSFGQYRDSGIVNAIDTPLNSSVVRTFHQQYESSELLLGFYPIAFLLWSEYEPRPVTDFLPLTEPSENYKAASIKLTQLPQNRRRQLLRLQSEWLLYDVKALYDSWVEGELYHLYHKQLPDQRLRVITDSLLHSIESMLASSGIDTHGLPGRFVEQHDASEGIHLASVAAYYMNNGLAAFWLTPEEREQAQILFAQLQAPETDATAEDRLMQLQVLMTLLSPDTPLINPN